ncbi:MAG: C-terminal target protein [Adhaeribacter sp.]|nr:C-terminal target protein [Adhaeribacter sp.]
MLKVYNPGKLKEGFLLIFCCLFSKKPNKSGTYRILNKLNNKASIPFSKGFTILVILYALASSQQLFSQTLPPGFTDTEVSAQWNEAVGLTFNKTGNQMFVWERTGRVYVVENNQRQVLIDLREEVAGYWDMGLLGFALHPQFETNGYFYLLYNVDRHHLLHYGTSNYNQNANEFYVASIGRLTRYTATKTATGYTVNPATRKVLIGATKTTGIPTTHISHGVGSLVFGTDGTLLVSTGDGAGANPNVGDTGSSPDTYYSQALADGIITEQENVGAFRSQLLESYNGKILRIDPETGNGIPSNPFYETANSGSVRSKVWALGLRNPFRMSLKPNSGSSNPAAGEPGVLYVGDVGYVTWEELDIINKPGLNLGWPLYEGLTAHDAFWGKKTYNKYAPNPLYGTNGCTQQYFYFQDLITQATHSGKASFTNPCNTTQPIPTTVKTYLHSRPVIDWKHEQVITRTATFSGETATVTNLGTSGSLVSGTPFSGSSVTGGVFYPHNDFPPEYQNTYFFGDYVGGWVRSLAVDNENNPTEIKSLIGNNAIVVGMATHPTDPGLYYISFTSQIRKISYNITNQPPVAVASANKTYGPSPLNIQFTGSASQDPDGQPLTCRWDFGDGASSTLPNPTHSFTTATNAPTQRTVTLTVTDSQGSSHQTSLIVSVNNTPPQVEITSPLDNTYYPMTGQTTYNLRANVTDSEHSSSQLSYKWQTTLHHASHKHPEPPDTSPETTAVISPLGCGAETYYYSITLTVTDAAGLATTKVVKLYPQCSSPPSVSITSPATNASYTAPATIALAANASDADGTITKVEFFQGTTKLGEDLSSPYNFTWSNVAAGSYSLTAKATDNSGLVTTSATVNITVNAPVPPTVSITAPTTGASYTAPATISITANATDADGTISKVEFFQGTTKLGEDLTAPYAYSWTGVAAGSYSLTAKATDNTGQVTTSAAVSISVNASVPVALKMALTTTVTQAEPWYGMYGPFEGAGAIDLNVSGGTSPYTYRWDSGTGTQDIPAASPGMYSVTVTDASGSQALTTLYVGRKNSPMTLSSAHINASGAATRDGSINLSVIGGVLPYTYRWSNGGTTEDVTGMPPGSYTVDVMDAFGKVVTTWVTVSQPGTALGLVVAHKNIIKSGSDDGFIDVTVKGGVGPYIYRWNSGAASQDLTRVTAGLYQIQVTDANGNTAFASVRVLAPGELPSAKSPIINEIFQAAEPDFVIYPNTTSDRSYVKFKLPSGGKYTLELYDNRGAKVKTIATGHTQAKKFQTFELNLVGYAQGLYLLKLITDHEITSKPLIIQP